MLEAKNITKKFGEQKVLNNVNFAINKGEVLVVVGPSGCGKTTLLRCIKGLEEINNGAILFQEEDKEKIGLVFQEFHIWDHMNVLENVMLAPRIVQKREKSEVYKKSLDVLRKVNLIDKVNNYPHQLSGGQKQRVAIARSLVMNPEILLLDEITSALDPELVASVLDVIKKLAKDGMTMVVVTHNLGFAKEIGDKFLFIENGQVVEFGSKDIFENPKNSRTRKFLVRKC
jgi:ABC-type polar amino acid transport system ATPase subunit|tara:strand:+ start:889 stop:1575 length:687 start_codon:yes stop_codon:yes gene_type:complete